LAYPEVVPRSDWRSTWAISVGPGGHERVLVFQRQAQSLQPLKVLTSASFVPLYGKHGFPPPET
jgi:hypothetical protein